MANFYYNGVLLPEVPVVEGYPYYGIRRHEPNNNYEVFYSTSGFYLGTANDVCTTDGEKCPRYTLPLDGNGEWTYLDTTYNSWVHDSSRNVFYSNSDVPKYNSTSIFLYGSEPVSEDRVGSKELTYDICDCYIGGDQILYDDNPTICYIVPVVIPSTYTVTLTEVGNRLRVAHSSIDPKTTTSSIFCTPILDASDFSVGYTFDYKATSNGWLVIYVSSAGETPKISVVTDGLGGDGGSSEPEVPEEPESHPSHYLIQYESLKAIADAIRVKTGGKDTLVFPDGIVDAIAKL